MLHSGVGVSQQHPESGWAPRSRHVVPPVCVESGGAANSIHALTCMWVFLQVQKPRCLEASRTGLTGGGGELLRSVTHADHTAPHGVWGPDFP